eukprot:comp20896_c0_seq1/m.27794 comp20896_c0_seq1/g.27794  ORF comp20896_c0_seq1/g.27794 comp20896_c0_seq1/m.27794 type:complete len:153 (-) comp20896_c0_seq1:745-1203(-)
MHVAVAVDGSAYSQYAFQWALHRVVRAGDQLTIVHVYPPLPQQGDDQGPDEEARRGMAEELVREYSYGVPMRDIKVQAELRAGEAGPQLVEFCRAAQPAMLVVGTHSHGLLATLVVGSVGRYVLSNAQVPVTIVPTPQAWLPNARQFEFLGM